METNANHEAAETEQPISQDNIHDPITKGPITKDSIDKALKDKASMSTETKEFENIDSDKIQRILADLDLNNPELLSELLGQKAAKNTPKPSVLESVKDNAVAQVKQFGASTAASLIAILIAVITPIILNSQFAQDVKQTIADLREQLPNEADELLMNQVTELSKSNQSLINQISSKQLLLQAQNSELTKGTETTRQEYRQVTQKLIELESRNKNLTDNSQLIGSLSKQVEELSKRVNRNNDGPNYALHKELLKLSTEGRKLTQNQIEKSENWFRRVFYTVQGLQKQEANQQLNSHVSVLKSIADKEDGYSEFNKRKQEALIVLNALGSLASAAIIR